MGSATFLTGMSAGSVVMGPRPDGPRYETVFVHDGNGTWSVYRDGTPFTSDQLAAFDPEPLPVTVPVGPQ